MLVRGVAARSAMRSRCLAAVGLAALGLGFGAAAGPGAVTAAAYAPAGSGAEAGTGDACGAFPGAHQLPGADGVVPAAWSGGGLVVPACGPVPEDGGTARPVHPYPGALWTAGYQCVEFSERYLYQRFGVTMDVATNGDQVAANYAARYAGLFMIIRNGTPHRAPAAGDVLSLSAAPGFDSANGGHSAVVQSSSVGPAGDGTVTVIEENADAGGVAVLSVSGWRVLDPGFRYVEWLTTAGLTVTSPHPPAVLAGVPYSFALTATGGRPPYRWRVTDGALPAGLALSAAGTLSGTVSTVTASAGTVSAETGDGTLAGRPPAAPVTVAVTDTRGATATAALALPLRGPPDTPVVRAPDHAAPADHTSTDQAGARQPGARQPPPSRHSAHGLARGGPAAKAADGRRCPPSHPAATKARRPSQY
jgi:Putative Ig domain/CHAP domain